MGYFSVQSFVALVLSSVAVAAIIATVRIHSSRLLKDELSRPAEEKLYAPLLAPALLLAAVDSALIAALSTLSTSIAMLVLVPAVLTIVFTLEHVVSRKLFEDFLFGSWRSRTDSGRTITGILFGVRPDRRIRGLFLLAVIYLFFGYFAAALTLWGIANLGLGQ